MSILLAMGLGHLAKKVLDEGKDPATAAKETVQDGVGIAKRMVAKKLDGAISRLPLENQDKEGLPSGAELVDQGVGIAKRVVLDPLANQAKKKIFK